MDPNAARARMIEKANVVLALFSQDASHPEANAAGVDLAEAVHDLDEWLRMGGFFPEAWHPPLVNRKRDVDIDIEAPQPSKMVDDEKPLVDTTEFCGYPYDGRLRCVLDKGHDGPHVG